MKKSSPIETMAVVPGLYKRIAHKPFSFDLKDVTGYGESPIEGHTEIIIPGATVTIKMNYEDFKLLKQKHDATNEIKN